MAGEKFRRYLYSFWRNSGTCRTDGRTPGDGIYHAYAYASCGNNANKLMMVKNCVHSTEDQ